MGIYPPSLERLIEQFAKLPGIGLKSATRMALYVLKSKRDIAEGLARSLIEVKEKIRLCSTCYNFTDDDPCPICRNERRADGTICVVETPADQLALEETGQLKGRYHVLHGVLSPLDGVGPEHLKSGELLTRIPKESVREVILATNPTAEGETTASFLAKLIADKFPEVAVTRIAVGVPMGGDGKYMDRGTLECALKQRNPVAL